MKGVNRQEQNRLFWVMLPLWLGLSGCESTVSLERNWLGKTRDSLVASWGLPNTIEESADGGTVYVYTRTYYPSYQESIGSPVNPTPYNPSRDGTDYPIQVRAESSTAKFWITPEGTIYRVQGRIIQ